MRVARRLLLASAMKRLVQWAAVAFVATSVATAAAQEQTENHDETPLLQGGAERELGRHRFIIPSDLDHAFMDTSFAFDQGFGALSVKTPDIDGKLFLLRERFRVQLGIADTFALEAAADAHAGVAGNADTLLALAGIAELQFIVGAKARILRLKELGLQVAIGLNFKPQLSYSISPIAGLEAGSVKQVLQKQNSSFIEPGVMAAWGNGPVGVQLLVRPSITTNSYKNPSALQAGGTVSLDFGNKDFVNVPVALNIEYELDKDFDGSDPQHFLTSGIFYSGKRDLQLGVRYSKIVGKPNQMLQFVTLNLGYFF